MTTYFTDRFWQMTAGFILTLFISIILMFFINLFDGKDVSPQVSPDSIVAGSEKGAVDNAAR